MITLSNEEIGYVKFFLYKKRHIYFEVQVEVMDHFFSVLEEERLQYPSAIFADLVDKTYAKCARDLNSIQTSLQKRLRTKFNQVFILELLKPLTNRYLFVVVLEGAVLYGAQLLLHGYISSLGFYVILGVINLIFLFSYMAPSNLINGNYLTEKISGNYGTVVWGFSIFSYLVIKHTAPVVLSSGFNISYLITAIALVFKSMLVNAMIQTSNSGVKECLIMEPANEALNA